LPKDLFNEWQNLYNEKVQNVLSLFQDASKNY